MSILIKGMEMPNGCKECSLYGAGIHICFAVDKQVPQIGGKPPKFCPLVEVPTPHGRLIDAEELCKRINRLYGLAYKQKRDEVLEVLGHNIIPMVVSAPTVIEAEGQK